MRSDKKHVKTSFSFRIPIAIKLIVITTGLLLAATVPIAFQSANRFEAISVDREEDSNRDQTGARATEVEGQFVNLVDKIKVTAALLQKDYASEEEKQKALELTFFQDREIVAVEVLSRRSANAGEPANRVVNEDYLKQYKLGREYIDRLRTSQDQTKRFQKAAVFAGQIEIRNASMEGGAPLITIGVPLVVDEVGAITHIAIGDLRLDRLQKVFGNVSERTLYLIDKEGALIAHPDDQKVLRAESMATSPIVKLAIDSQFKQGQMRFQDPQTGEAFTGAYAKTALGLTVIALASEKVILEAARTVRREAFYIAGRVLSIALFLIFVFSISLTAPIEKLSEMTQQIARGNFKVKSGVRSHDEVGELATAFDQMVEGLEERDKVKNVLNKFHGSSVAEDLLKGDIGLGGSRKDVTVMFSDLRGFTKFSEGRSPEKVVEMLNEYFQVMVSIINKNNGVVDKFIGDAIMAVWGAPHSSDRDAHNAVRACLEMRQGLDKLNELRLSRGESAIMIGIGLHSGSAISGTIGSSERMEYTVIGDTVNQSSRIEASTKAFGTDLLLSHETMNLVGSEFLVEKAGVVEVKGKSEPLALYKVRGFIENGQPVIVKTPYSDFEAEAADKVKIAS